MLHELIYLYNTNKSKKLYKLDGSYIIEEHGLTYIFPILLMKLGLFDNSISKTLYKYIAKQIYDKSNKKFTSNRECKNAIIDFISTHKFNQYQLEEIKHKTLNIKTYPSINSFFIREIDMSLRPQIINKNKLNLYSPADCRLQVVNANKTFIIKGKNIRLNDIGFDSKIECSTIMICRLAPCDYHRFHSPVYGKIIDIIDIKSEMNISVNDMVIPEFNPYTINSRKIIKILLKTKQVLEMCIIGATFVGDIIINKIIGNVLYAGDEIGYFKLGSCIILKLCNTMLDNRLIYNNEYYINVKEKLGYFT
jgi:phosphatidylserine decarboxylase